ncbi:MAG: NusG domain II-containing protein [Acidaminobacteraceae bacterium]
MKKYDYILISFYVIISIAISISSLLYIKKIDNPIAEVTYDGQKILEVDLSENSIVKFEFATNIGYLEIKDEKVRIIEMPKSICPQRICSKFNWINRQGDILVCLPNKLTVEIKASRVTNEIDALSF